MLLATPVGGRLSRTVVEWLDSDPRRRVWISGVVGGLGGSVVYVLFMLLPGVPTFLSLLFGPSPAYQIVVAILLIGFGVFLGMLFAQMRQGLPLW